MNVIHMGVVTGTTGGGAVARGINALRAGAICLLFLMGSHPAQATTSTYSIELPTDQTDSKFRAPILSAPAQSTGQAVLEIRRRSGLTWEELGQLFDVSRRSVHNWASGEILAAKNERQVRLILGVLRQIDQGEPRKTRDALLMADAKGVSALTLLKAGDFSGATSLVGAVPEARRAYTSISGTGKSAQGRQRAATYLDAEYAPAAPASGKSKLARVYRTPRA